MGSVPEIESGIGDAVFPGERQNVLYTMWALSKDYIDTVLKDGDGAPFAYAFLAVSADYRYGVDWGMTTIVFAIDNAILDSTGWNEPWDTSEGKSYPRETILLRKLPLETSAN